MSNKVKLFKHGFETGVKIASYIPKGNLATTLAIAGIGIAAKHYFGASKVSKGSSAHFKHKNHKNGKHKK